MEKYIVSTLVSIIPTNLELNLDFFPQFYKTFIRNRIVHNINIRNIHNINHLIEYRKNGSEYNSVEQINSVLMQRNRMGSFNTQEKSLHKVRKVTQPRTVVQFQSSKRK